MSFQPKVNQILTIDGVAFSIAEHPSAPGMPYGQEGRQATVYQLRSSDDGVCRALKVFKSRYRVPSLVSLADRLAAFAPLQGLTVCQRTVLTPQRHALLLRQYSDLTYSVLMPWVDGPTWVEVLLEGRELTPEQSLSLARTFSDILSAMEQQGVAHCDLSGPNLLLPFFAAGSKAVPARSRIELVDVEQLYSPILDRPVALPGGSPGYAHRTPPQGLWQQEADRYAGAILLAEMLGWCDERIRQRVWGESYFDPGEMQQGGERYRVLLTVLSERWGHEVANLFDRAWESDTVADCPTFGEWLVMLPETVPAMQKIIEQLEFNEQPILDRSDEVAPELGAATATAHSRSLDKEQLANMFADGLAAYKQDDWARAKELLTEVLRQQPDYRSGKQMAAKLLVDIERHLTKQAPAPPRSRRWAWLVPALMLTVLVPFGGMAIYQAQVSAAAQANATAMAVALATEQTLQATATAQAEATMLAQVQVARTSTVQAQSTSTANANATSTVYAIQLAADEHVRQTATVSAQETTAAQMTATAVAQATETAVFETTAVDQAQMTATVRAIEARATNQAMQTATVQAVQTSQAATAEAKATTQAQAAQVTATTRALAAFTPSPTPTSVRPTPTSETVPTAALIPTPILVPTASPVPPTNTPVTSSVRTLQGHASSVNSVAFSPDGQLLASGSNDNTIKLWRVSDGQELRTLQGHRRQVHSIAFSPDGQLLASGSNDDTVKLWRVSDGQEVRTLQVGWIVNSVAFSPDGQLLAASLLDNTIRLWRVSDGQEVRTLPKSWLVYDVAFSPDGQLLASASADAYDVGTIKLWRVGDGQLLRTIQTHTYIVSSVAFSPDGQTLASGSSDNNDKTIKLWGVADGSLILTLFGHTDRVSGVAFSPDGQLLASSSADKTIILWRASDGQLLRTLEGHTSEVNSVTFSPDGQVLASGSWDYTIKLWRVR